jgi:hypothetical protein
MTTTHDAASAFPNEDLYTETPAELKATADAAVTAHQNWHAADNASTSSSFKKVAGFPTVATLSPASAVKVTAPAGTTEVGVTGDNFDPTSVVLWDGVEVPTEYVSPVSLIATAPESTTAQTDTVVVSTTGRLSGSLTFTWTAS